MPVDVGTKLGPYEIVARIGAGGMGEVYRAFDTKLKREVAIKVLPEVVVGDTDHTTRFAREADLLASLNHPNLAAIHTIDEHAGRPFIVMELLTGPTLRSVIDGPQLSIERVLELALQIVDGLAAAHAHGVIHRDIKPENIVIAEDGHVKLLDFGLAKLVPGAELETIAAAAPRLTQTGTVMGTVSYMSPEQARGETTDGRTDLFSLGVVLYEIITGRLPFRGNTPAAIFDAILNRTPQPIQELNSAAPRASAHRRQAARKGSSASLPKPGRLAIGPRAPRSRDGFRITPGGTGFGRQEVDRRRAFFGRQPRQGQGVLGGRPLGRNHRGSVQDPVDPRDLAQLEHAVEDRRLGREEDRARASSSIPARGHRALGGRQPARHRAARRGRERSESLGGQVLGQARGRLRHPRANLAPDRRRAEDAAHADGGAAAWDRKITDVRAYDCYQRARQDIYSFSEDGLERALRLIEDALAIVGDNDLLYTAQGTVYWQYVNAGIRPDDRYLDMAEDCAKKVFRLDSESASGVLLLGLVQMARGHRAEALRSLKRALALEPNNVQALNELGRLYFASGKTREARDAATRMLALDPLSLIAQFLVFVVEALEGDPERWRPLADRVLEIAPYYAILRFCYAVWLVHTGRLDAARTLLTRAPDDARQPIASPCCNFLRHALDGRRDEALARFSNDVQTAARHVEWWSFCLSWCYAFIDETELALDWLDNAFQRGFLHYPFLSRPDVPFARFRGQARFDALLEKIKHAWEKFPV